MTSHIVLSLHQEAGSQLFSPLFLLVHIPAMMRPGISRQAEYISVQPVLLSPAWIACPDQWHSEMVTACMWGECYSVTSLSKQNPRQPIFGGPKLGWSPYLGREAWPVRILYVPLHSRDVAVFSPDMPCGGPPIPIADVGLQCI